MPTYGHDEGFNLVEVPSLEEFSIVENKQDKLLKDPGVIPTDANQIKTTGVYYISSITQNMPPETGTYTLFVLSASETGNFVMQMALLKSSKSLYFRVFSESAWTDWELYLSITKYEREKAKFSVDIASLDPTQIFTKDSLLMIQTDENKKVAIRDFTSMILYSMEYTALDTEAKTIIGAVNEINHKLDSLEADDTVFPEVL